ncbi:hypothetical protein GWI33_014030 [Rhynchophorus ferrugineus]|uniref:Uncharacterized protein n=1 Tax=Rhynchophorus ferrugineus TaxID=354439 RepID=A0A834MB08_RHYFE|nr:hypothetical protein GWI33_014030 [Rhynchophorus ferrugineus]
MGGAGAIYDFYSPTEERRTNSARTPFDDDDETAIYFPPARELSFRNRPCEIEKNSPYGPSVERSMGKSIIRNCVDTHSSSSKTLPT